jgi:glycosyltransferase involved in cell wall biosynthesis
MEDLLPRRAREQNLVLPNGVDRQHFAPIDKAQARQALGWNPDHPIALFAANPGNPRKRHDLAVEAVRIATESLPGLRLEVAWGVTPAAMPTYLSAADVLLHPSIAEGSPNIVKEACACDLPVIGTDVGDIPELLAGVRNCRVEERTAPAFASAMVEVIRSGERSDGRAKTEHLSIDRVAETLVAYYRQHAASPRPSQA